MEMDHINIDAIRQVQSVLDDKEEWVLENEAAFGPFYRCCFAPILEM